MCGREAVSVAWNRVPPYDFQGGGVGGGGGGGSTRVAGVTPATPVPIAPFYGHREVGDGGGRKEVGWEPFLYVVNGNMNVVVVV